MRNTRVFSNISRLEASVPVADFVRQGVDVPRFLELCRACTQFGRRWSCPPFDFDPPAIWGRYRHMRIHALCIRMGEQASPTDAMNIMEHCKAFFHTELLAMEAASAGSLALTAGACTLCPSCARPEGMPCRHPDKMRHSIEALGGNVALVAEQYLHSPLQWFDGDTPPGQLLLVGAVLEG